MSTRHRLPILILTHAFPGNGKGQMIAGKTKCILDKLNIANELWDEIWPEELSKFESVWIAGGDGTVFYFINHYKNFSLPVGLLGGGTGNDLKTHLYGSLPLEMHIQKLLDSHWQEIDIGNCNGEFYVNSLGIGFDGEVLKNIHSIRKLGGHLGYLLAVIKVIFTFKERTFILETSEKTWNIQPVILAVSNSVLTGGGFKIAPAASLSDRKLDLLYTKPLAWWKRLWILPKVEKGTHLTHSAVYHHHVSQVRIKSEHDVMYQIDGELKKSKEFDIFISNEKLKILLFENQIKVKSNISDKDFHLE